MATLTATAASAQQPSVTPDAAAETYAVRGVITLPATLALNDIVELVKLPADCVPVDFTIDTDSLAASGLAMSVGFTAGTVAELRVATAIANAAPALVRMDSILPMRVAPVATGDRTVGVKVTTAGVTPTAGVFGFTLFYRAARFGG